MTVPITWRTDMRNFASFPWRTPGGFWCPDKEDGAAQWHCEEEQPRYIDYVCPCGCKDWRSIPVQMVGQPDRGWVWDGNETAPTLTPSILHTKSEGSGNCGWHGYLTAGVWVTV